MKKKKKSITILMLFLVSPYLFISNPHIVEAANYTITIDAGQRGDRWNRFYEKCVSQCHANVVLTTGFGRNIQNALKKGRDEAGFQYIRFHGILNDDVGVYSENNGNPVYNWTNFDRIFDAIKNAGMRPILEISFTPSALASGNTTLHWYNGVPAHTDPPKDWNKWMNLMADIVRHCEQRYGTDEVRNNWYFEVWNEPDWMLVGGFEAYVTLFGYTEKGLRNGDTLVRVGGPAQSGPSSTYAIPGLIEHCRNNDIQLDFLTYHRYANDTDYGGSFSNANSMRDFHRAMVDLARQYNFTGELINDEWGPTYTTDVCRDNETSASFIAKTIHLIGTDSYPPPVMFGYWTLSDLYEEFNTGNTTAYHEGNYGLLLKGDAQYPDSYDLAKPAFNAFRLLHMMGDVRISCNGGTTADGVNAAATISNDNNSIQILTYNHVNGAAANSSNYDNVTLSVNNIPFAPGTIRVEHFVIDRTRSNSHTTWVGMGKPSRPNQSQWAELKIASELAYQDPVATVNLTGSSFNKTFSQYTYSVGLIVLSAAGGSSTNPPGQTPVPTNTPTPVQNLGDVNNNGTIDIVDALLVAQYYVGLNPSNFDISRADTNCDGSVNIVDALLIAQYYVGSINRFC